MSACWLVHQAKFWKMFFFFFFENRLSGIIDEKTHLPLLWANWREVSHTSWCCTLKSQKEKIRWIIFMSVAMTTNPATSARIWTIMPKQGFSAWSPLTMLPSKPSKSTTPPTLGNMRNKIKCTRIHILFWGNTCKKCLTWLMLETRIDCLGAILWHQPSGGAIGFTSHAWDHERRAADIHKENDHCLTFSQCKCLRWLPTFHCGCWKGVSFQVLSKCNSPFYSQYSDRLEA